MPQIKIYSSSSTVIVVDDSASDYLFLESIAQLAAVPLLFATTGAEALRFANENQVLLWLINTRLPDFTGFDLVEMLQPLPVGTSACLVSDNYHISDELRALNLGVTKYLVKPFSENFWSSFRLRPAPSLGFSLAADARTPFG